ncbi:hypothetical protein L0664_00135 [Octadecabacter sp. G9-8]|uniref:O-antigen ligase domain-containing protein n=1 Tax=Octadecabacter dasysiphoniae TaxID=2909341 RepID=A0ABS9CSP5_9RHOB|nr:hypothetical protein [Octadecabacter dasysiphoniae]MCF2869460.1 hypothetical protein [Octadecabacter dasysiphoniae]
MVIIAALIAALFYWAARNITCHARVLSLTFSVLTGTVFGLPLATIFLGKGICLILTILVDVMLTRRMVIPAIVFKRPQAYFALCLVGLLPGMVLGVAAGHSAQDISVALFLVISPIFGYVLGIATPNQPVLRESWVNVLILTVPLIFLLFQGFALNLERLVFGSIAVGGLYGHILFLIVAVSALSGPKRWFLLGISFYDVIYGGSRRYLLPVAGFVVYYFLAGGEQTRKVIRSRNTFIRVGLVILGAVAVGLVAIVRPDIFVADVRGVGYRVVQNAIFWEYMDTPLTWAAGLGAGYSSLEQYSATWYEDFGPRLHSYYYSILMNFGILGLVLSVLPLTLRFRIFITSGHIGFAVFSLGWIISGQFDTPPDGFWVIGWLVGYCERIGVNSGQDSRNS